MCAKGSWFPLDLFKSQQDTMPSIFAIWTVPGPLLKSQVSTLRSALLSLADLPDGWPIGLWGWQLPRKPCVCFGTLSHPIHFTPYVLYLIACTVQIYPPRVQSDTIKFIYFQGLHRFTTLHLCSYDSLVDMVGCCQAQVRWQLPSTAKHSRPWMAVLPMAEKVFGGDIWPSRNSPDSI